MSVNKGTGNFLAGRFSRDIFFLIDYSPFVMMDYRTATHHNTIGGIV